MGENSFWVTRKAKERKLGFYCQFRVCVYWWMWGRWGYCRSRKQKKKVFTIAVNSNWGYFSKKEVEEKGRREENSIYGEERRKETP